MTLSFLIIRLINLNYGIGVEHGIATTHHAYSIQKNFAFIPVLLFERCTVRDCKQNYTSNMTSHRKIAYISGYLRCKNASIP